MGLEPGITVLMAQGDQPERTPTAGSRTRERRNLELSIVVVLSMNEDMGGHGVELTTAVRRSCLPAHRLVHEPEFELRKPARRP